MRVWRLVHTRRAADAFSGEGAALHGGRFNGVGIPVVYTSGTLSLAILEVIAQIGSLRRLKDFVSLTADFDPDLVEETSEPLPKGWDAVPHGSVSQKIGDQWVAKRRSAVLRIPSVVVPGEFNYLINPNHPDFSDVKIGQPQPIPIDARIAHSVE